MRLARTPDISTERNEHDCWDTPPETLTLHPSEVHVWRVSLPALHNDLDRWREVLSKDERHRADQFRFSEHRNAYTTTRAIVRELLARYLKQPPESLCFVVNEYGKPALTSDCNLQCVQFNVSHSGDYALLAFGMDRPLGVDVERIRADVREITNKILSSAEKEQFEQLPSARQLASLFHVWTSKEATIKALGKGFSIPLDEVEVAIDPGFPPSLVRLSPQVGHADDWKLYGLGVDEEYSATVAVSVSIRHLRCWTGSAF